MARLARAVIPEDSHPITPGGHSRPETFVTDEDYRSYSELMAAGCHRFGVEVRAYCLVPNHAHLMAVPESENSLHQAGCKIGGTESKTEDGL
jgi:REP-associated tyrosine transposase